MSASPDGQWVLFRDALTLRKVGITGGPAITVATVAGQPRGQTWGPDGTIVFATAAPGTGLERVSGDGGDVTILTTPNRDRGEGDHVWPEFLPDGQAVLFTITPARGGLDAAQIAVLDLQRGTQTVLLRGGSHARYVPTGHLIYGAGGAMRAVPFDVRRRVVTGTPVPVLDSVAISPDGFLEADIAADGTLVYLSGDASLSAARTLVWVDRQDREEPIAAPPRAYNYPRLSPDGTRLAVYSADEQLDLWVWELTRATPTLTRLTFDPAPDFIPVWAPDGRRLFFSSQRSGVQNLFIVSADGNGGETRIVESPNPQAPSGITPDGTRVVIYEQNPSGTRDLKVVTIAASPQVQALIATPFEERGGTVSPNGRWLAYESDHSGRFEVYVRPFPAVSDGLSQVSTGGGVQPAWVATGRELVYRAPDGAVMAVPVTASGTTWSSGTPTEIIKPHYFAGTGVSRSYDVSANGQRFLMIKEDAATSSVPIMVVQNWFEELRRLMPPK